LEFQVNAKPEQFALLKREKSEYGGELMKTRKGRAHGRPLSTRESMHLTLRSTKARGDWSFRRGANPAKIDAIIKKFTAKYGVRVISKSNDGNHLHLHVRLANRQSYKPFIRAVTAAIAMAVTGACRWRTKAKIMGERKSSTPCTKVRSVVKNVATDESASVSDMKFWDYRPFTRIVQGLRDFLALEDYIRINQLEGAGRKREDAEMIVKLGWLDNFHRSRL
jgi:REP element-mobilizing transposase RayT